MLVLALDVPGADAITGVLPGAFRAIDLSGVLLNGILGGLIARRRNFDLVGFVVLALLTATAGGILRDVMLQAGPPVALTDPYYLATACAGAVVAWWVPFTSRPARRFLVVADAVVLGTWAATGASKALANGLGVLPALMLGCLTAVGGSIIRDVSVGETPAVFGGNKLYAIPALCSAVTEVVAQGVGVEGTIAMLAATAVGAGTCLAAYRRSWRLPVALERRTGPSARRRDSVGGRRRLRPGLRAPGGSRNETARTGERRAGGGGWRGALLGGSRRRRQGQEGQETGRTSASSTSTGS